MNAILAVLGFIILVAGNQSGWIFVGGLSFVIGHLITSYFDLVQSPMESVLYSLVSAVIGAMLVIYFKRILVVLAAAFVGFYVCLYLPPLLEMDTAWISLPVLVLAAILFGLVTLVWGALPLIVVSTLMGATLIIQNVQFGAITDLAMFFVLMMFGLIAQFVLWQYSQSEPV